LLTRTGTASMSVPLSNCVGVLSCDSQAEWRWRRVQQS
jgi:hypothetical protein